MTLSKGNLFNPELITDLINKVKGKSSLAVLSQQTPISFNGQKEITRRYLTGSINNYPDQSRIRRSRI